MKEIVHGRSRPCWPSKCGRGSAGKWKFDKEHRFLFIDKICGRSDSARVYRPIEAGIREALDNGIWRDSHGGRCRPY